MPPTPDAALPTIRPRPGRAVALAVALAAAAAGCGRSDDKAKAGAAPAAPPVTVATPLVREVVDWDEFTGYLEAPQAVEVRARVGGQVAQVAFNEGSYVKEGDLLVQLDVRPLQAVLDARLAELENAKAQAAVTKVKVDRYASIVESKAISQIDYEEAKAQYQQALAQQQAAEAAVNAAKLDVQFTEVRAPISGKISSRYVTQGNLVAGGSDAGTLLTTIQSSDPIYCYVNIDERSLIKYRALNNAMSRAAGEATTRPARGPCYLGLLGEPGTPHAGRLDFADNRVDPATGTLRLRGVFENRANLFTPGMFARMRVPASGRYQATLIPDAAIGTQQNLKYVFVVDAEDKVKLTPVTLGTLFGTLRSITEGVKPGDRVVINGITNARDGIKVTPKVAEIPADAFKNTGAPGDAFGATTQALPAASQPTAAGQQGFGRPAGTGGTDAAGPANDAGPAKDVGPATTAPAARDGGSPR